MNHRRPLVPSILLVLVCACSRGQSAGTPPSERVCTQIGCVDGLTITLNKPGPWQAGGYTFDVTLDGDKVTCTSTLPLKGCEAGPTTTCDPTGRVEIVESGCALPPEQQGFAEIRVPARVAQVAVSIARDGEKLAEAALAPKYVETRPNGPDCEPVCQVAAEQIAVP